MVDNPAKEEAEIALEAPYDAGDPEQVNNARKRAGRERREELEVVKALMNLPAGRRWLYNKLVMCKVFTSPFVPGRDGQTEFFAGMQAMGHLLQDDIMSAAPDLYMAMCTENDARSKRQFRKKLQD